MRNRHHILWYKPGDGRPREFYLGPTMFGFVIGVPIAVVLLLLVGGLHYTRLVQRSIERDHLFEENQRLRVEVSRIEQLSNELSELQRFSRQVQRSLTEGTDLERIIEAGEAIERELPSSSGQGPWVPVETGENEQYTPPLEMLASLPSDLSLQLPDRWPVEGFVTRNFELISVDPSRNHLGMDLAVPRGTPVRAVAPGTIIVADWNPRYGHRVIIDHGGALVTVYGHNELLLVMPGDEVEAGAPISLSGNSGISTAPHLHFEMWVNGEAMDPRAILPQRGEQDGF